MVTSPHDLGAEVVIEDDEFDAEIIEEVETEYEPWDRLTDEPAKAYAAFRYFRDLPPLQRELAAIAKVAGVGERRIRALSQKWGWIDRANAWDDACHQIEDQERLESIRAMHAVHRNAGRKAIEKAVEALQYLDPATITHPTAIARLLETGAKLERNTLLVSVEEMQGLETVDEESEDPWDRIARELDPTNADLNPDPDQ